VGRWLNPDGLLDTTDAQGLNLYAYCGNDPVNGYDPSGMIRDGHWELGIWIPDPVASVYDGGSPTSMSCQGAATNDPGVTCHASEVVSKSVLSATVIGAVVSPYLNPEVFKDMSPEKIGKALYGNDNEIYFKGKFNGHYKWYYKNGGEAIRIDPADSGTPYEHVHLFDRAGNALDAGGNIITDESSPALHMECLGPEVEQANLGTMAWEEIMSTSPEAYEELLAETYTFKMEDK